MTQHIVPAPPLSWMASMRWPLLQQLLSDVPASSRVLEIGCGQGAVGARLAAMFGSYTGVEPDRESATVAAARVEPHGGRIVSDLADVDGPLADVLCAFEVLEHIDDDASALQEWLRRAAPGALALFSVPADPDRFSTTDRLVGHYRRYTQEQLSGVLREAGLEQVRVRRYGYPLAYALEGVRNALAVRRLDGADAESMEARSHGSGRLLQPTRPWQGTARRLVTGPFVAWQRPHPDRGPCFVAAGRVPVTPHL